MYIVCCLEQSQHPSHHNMHIRIDTTMKFYVGTSVRMSGNNVLVCSIRNHIAKVILALDLLQDVETIMKL